MAPSEEMIKLELLVDCAKVGNLQRIRYLVEERGTNVNGSNRDGENALWAAATASAESVVEYLLSKGADVNIRLKGSKWAESGVTPLFMAASNGNVNICKLLIEHGANFKLGTGSLSVLDAAIMSGNPECIDLILDRGGYDIDGYNVHGLTPLMLALSRGKSDCIRFLLEKGANYEKPAEYGDPPLFQALGIMAHNCSEVLLEHIKSKRGKKFVCNYVNRFNPSTKQTALHMAYMFGRKKEVETLLKYGANPTIRDKYGKLPKDLEGIALDNDFLEHRSINLMLMSFY